MKLAKHGWFPIGLLLLTPSLAGAERVGFEVEGAVTQVIGNAPNGIAVPDRAVVRFAFDADLAAEETVPCADERRYVLPPGAGELRITIRGYTWVHNAVAQTISIGNDVSCYGSPICDSFTLNSEAIEQRLILAIADCIAPFEIVDQDFLHAGSFAFEKATSSGAGIVEPGLRINIGLEQTVDVAPIAWGHVKTLYR